MLKRTNIAASIMTDICTTKSGDFCNIKIAGHFVILTFLALTAYTTIKAAEKFDPIAFGTGSGLILGAVAGSQKVKDSTEPQKPEQS